MYILYTQCTFLCPNGWRSENTFVLTILTILLTDVFEFIFLKKHIYEFRSKDFRVL